MAYDTVFVPSGDFTGLLADVIPLAGQDKEIPETFAVRVQWDGEQLHAMATDDTRMGVSSWHPDDLPEAAEQEGVFARRGGQCRPWSVVIGLPDAALMAKTFKVSEKNWWVPLALDYVEGITDTAKLRVARNTDCGMPGLSMTVLDRPVDLPDVRKLLDVVPPEREVSRIKFNGELLAGFGQVRQRGGGLEFTFSGPDSMTLVTVGERFRGGIQPVRAERRRLASVA
ncbi:hypothetical protein ABZ671_00580 [Micromonospora sp. NPDC006766]|uniref:hypothetical protein n=1 Tax=Micromonospora sp. NPDC006766 TaxID=3154778 RepID=UPI0033F267C7